MTDKKPTSPGLPDDYEARKNLPVFDGVVMYFPDAIAAIAEVSRKGNDQHNPGEPLHWARGKSMDQFNTALRHQIDHRRGKRYDVDGSRHLAKAAWRVLAALQLDIEAEHGEHTGRQGEGQGTQGAEGSFGVLAHASPEWDGETSARLPRVRKGILRGGRNKGSRRKANR